jgi:hypothetical protein
VCAALRWLGAAAAWVSVGAVAAGEARVEVWIELSAPPPRPDATAAVRAAALRDIDAQQAALVAALQALGGVERGRVRLVLNAVAMDLPVQAVETARAWPGVKAVRVVQHRTHVEPARR